MNAVQMSSGALLEEELVLPPELDSRANTQPSPLAARIAQTLVLATLFAVPALLCLHIAYVADPDLGWHIATADWITQHHAIPHSDPFSRSLAGQPWQAYSWLYELLIATLYHRFGLVGVLVYSCGMVLAITAALFHLVKRLQSDFSIAVLITFAAAFSMGRLYTPRPWHFTILLFLLELQILTRIRTAQPDKPSTLKPLLWLPLIFALWANLHIQFIDGLAVLALAFAESLILHRRTKRTLYLGGVLAASILATFLNPYGPYIYRTAYDLATQSGVLDLISELAAIPFRTFPDFTLLLLAFAAAISLTYTTAQAVILGRRRIPFFEAALFILAAILAFRSLRDMWIMAAASTLILAGNLITKNQDTHRVPAFITPIAMLLAAMAVFIGFQAWSINNPRLVELQSETLPLKAVQFIQQKELTGPIFNDFGWGGYLILALRQPVTIDGRAALYGTDRLNRGRDTFNGQPGWNANPDLTSANLILTPIKSPLNQLLLLDPHYELFYEDDLAAVFIPRR